MAHGACTWAPNGERTHDPPVADLVAEALDDDRAVVGHGAGGLGLLVEVLQEVAGGEVVEAVALAEPVEGGRRRGVAHLAHELAHGPARARAAGRARRRARTASSRAGPGAGVTTTRSWVMSSIRHVDAPSRNVSPGRDS